MIFWTVLIYLFGWSNAAEYANPDYYSIRCQSHPSSGVASSTSKYDAEVVSRSTHSVMVMTGITSVLVPLTTRDEHASNPIGPMMASKTASDQSQYSRQNGSAYITAMTTSSTVPSATCKPEAQITHQVIVGASGHLTFEPDAVEAAVGEVIEFNFLSLNHTLTQSSFIHPCQNAAKFNTDFHQYNPHNETGRFLVSLTVDVDQPQWFHCAQTSNTSHCEAGMVFGLNPGGLMDQFISNAVQNISITPTINGPPFQILSASKYPSNSLITLTSPHQPSNITPLIDNGGLRIMYNVQMIFTLFALIAGLNHWLF
ncbi:MAG: hypothetical protein M1824_001075 [Vezdaea acicularis]|nr:MAG: hypothetical protein M1824_001075 [Vezdaea acicularis]